jgi:magnesium transporter
VIDKKERFLGVVTSDTLLEIMHQEANQDFFYMAGSNKGVLKASVSSQVKSRLPWVLVGLASGVVSTSVIAGYESVLIELIKVAAFIPVILSISGNVATQSSILFVREIAFDRVSWGLKQVVHEGLIGMIIGLLSGLSLALLAVFLHGEPLVGLIVAVTIVITQAVAAMLGLTIPWIFKKLGKDPALGSGSVVTTLMDIVATSVYLTIAWVFLKLF